MLVIDGSQGEGGGQILRTALALSATTRTGFRIYRVRAGRRKPGLLRQHLTAVKAAARIAEADVDGADLGSRELTFQPRGVVPGDYTFSVGTAGSATLVMQTVLAPLLTAPGPSRLTLEGGTHNPFAPPFDFLDRVFLPLVNRTGPSVTTALGRAGFYPRGGGRFHVAVEPTGQLSGFELLDRGKVHRRRARAVIANLPRHIAERELDTIRRATGWDRNDLHVEVMPGEWGPGNAALIELECERVTELFTAFGQRGVRAEAVAGQVADEARRYLDADVPVGEHLADQLLLPLALAGSGSFRTLSPTPHTLTNIEVIKIFLGVPIAARPADGDAWIIELG